MPVDLPLLLLDVDGCLSPLLEDSVRPPAPYVRLFGQVSVHEDLADWLAKLTLVFQPAWLTTWGQDINQLFGSSLGLPPFPILDAVTNGSKWAAIRRHVRGSPFAWVDDQMSKEALRWIAQRNQAIPTIGILTDSSKGIQREHVNALLQFAEQAS